jgi:acyl carrier protein
LDVNEEVRAVLEDVLSLKGRSRTFGASSSLLGAVPELDSMAVAGILTSLEERLGIVVEDDEIDGSVFETFGSLVSYVEGKLVG